jgi:hypothetical protein
MTAVPVLGPKVLVPTVVVPKVVVPKVVVPKVVVPRVSVPAARDAGPARAAAVHSIDRRSRRLASQRVRPNAIAHPTLAPASWQLTDRGIVVAMAIAALILTAAVVVIGLTAVRVTSPDYDRGLQQFQQAQR